MKNNKQDKLLTDAYNKVSDLLRQFSHGTIDVPYLETVDLETQIDIAKSKAEQEVLQNLQK